MCCSSTVLCELICLLHLGSPHVKWTSSLLILMLCALFSAAQVYFDFKTLLWVWILQISQTTLQAPPRCCGWHKHSKQDLLHALYWNTIKNLFSKTYFLVSYFQDVSFCPNSYKRTKNILLTFATQFYTFFVPLVLCCYRILCPRFPLSLKKISSVFTSLGSYEQASHHRTTKWVSIITICEPESR